jgi:UDP-glucose 4-epimerase
MTRSCVVLGGCGFLGTNLCRRLVSSGMRVRAFGRSCRFPQDLEHVEWYQGDFADTAALASAVGSFQLVFHLIHTNTPQSANLDPAGDIRGNVISSLALLETCRNLKVERIVFVSSGGTIYGLAKEIPTEESAPTDPIAAYGISNLAIEKYLALYEHLYGLSFRVLRVANPYGPYQIPLKGQGIIAAVISRAIDNESVDIWGDGSVVRDFVFVDDVIDALEAASSDQSSQRIFNVGSGTGRTLREVISTIEMQLGARLRINWKVGRNFDVPSSILAIDRAREVLKWSPKTSFEDGLQQTVTWWRCKQARR